MPRFVVLQHETPAGYERPAHFDFMLQWGAALRTWAITNPPASGVPQSAEALPDHRTAYLEFEGEVSGNRGFVTRWDAGTFDLLVDAEQRVEVRVRGVRLRGSIRLRRDASASGWMFLFESDG